MLLSQPYGSENGFKMGIKEHGGERKSASQNAHFLFIYFVFVEDCKYDLKARDSGVPHTGNRVAR